MAYEVFVSSTRQDLISFRDVVSRRLRQEGYWTIEMETFGARDQEPLDASLQEVADADLFVGIYAWRYGFVPKGSTLSITEQELLEAERRNIPVFCFILDENDQSWPVELREGGEGARKLEALKQRIRERWVVETFTTPEGLAAGVLASLAGWQKRQAVAHLPERSVQLELLKKVERFWLDGVLRKAVPEGRRLSIVRKERPEAVGRPALEETAGAAEIHETPIHDLFLDQGRSLLLLGEPGSGKTIALLELARGLARVARRAPSAAVPVVFNLASWKGEDRSLGDWMARELSRRYQAGTRTAAEWVARHQILPLLDGLDEVEPDCRSGCVDAINAHLREHALAAGIAVACHTHVYEELPARLQLETALLLQPLAPAQVDEHLAAAGAELAGLRTALASDRDLRKLAASPLMLSLLERTFRNAAPEDVPSGRSDLFEAFVTRMLEPGRELPWRREEAEGPRGLRRKLPWNRHRGASATPLPEGRYSPGRTRRSLAWLARGMARHNPALVQVERLQPDWLGSRLQIFAYAVLSRALGGCLLGLPLALAFEWKLAVAALLAGALVGAVETFRLGRTSAIRRRRIGRGLLLGGVTFASILLLGLPWVMAADGELEEWRRAMLVRTGVFFSLLCGGIFGARGAGRGGNRDIRVAEALVWKAWPWRRSAIGAVSVLICSLAFWVLFLLIPDKSLSYLRGPDFWVPISLLLALFGGLLFGAFGGLGGRTLEKKSWPNQGTWLALRNAGVVGLITGLAGAIGFGLLLGAYEAAAQLLERSVLMWSTLLRLPLQTGLALGAWFGLAYSGLDFVQHFSLRLVLRLAKLVPGRLVGLLDHAVERGLLQRPGGSYKFFHPLLQDFFRSERGDGAGDGIRTRDQQLGRL